MIVSADVVILGAALVGLILGAFGGFSSALSFVVATLGASLAGRSFWAFATRQWENMGVRAGAVLVVSLVVFGVVRVVVRRLVGRLLAQPADAIFGALVSGALALILAVAGFLVAQHFGYVTDESSIFLREAASFVR